MVNSYVELIHSPSDLGSGSGMDPHLFLPFPLDLAPFIPLIPSSFLVFDSFITALITKITKIRNLNA